MNNWARDTIHGKARFRLGWRDRISHAVNILLTGELLVETTCETENVVGRTECWAELRTNRPAWLRRKEIYPMKDAGGSGD